MSTLTFHRTYFLEDEVVDGNLGDTNVVTDVHENISASDAARLIRREGLTFEATGNDWAANPDGSFITNYGTGERCEHTAHLSGFHPRVQAAIMAAVDA